MSEPRGALLVGSVPFDSAEEVFRAAGTDLGGHLRRIPDGEPGERDTWIVFQAGVFQRHPDIEPAKRDEEGYADVLPQFKLRDGVDPGSVDLAPLGYADSALESYATFSRLRDQGVLPASARFSVSLPTPVATISTFVEPAQQAALEPIYERALLAELDRIQDNIPHEDLAVQWDLAMEPAMWEGVGGMFTPWFEPVREGTLDRAVRAMNRVADDVELGIHLCYGDFGHEHYLQPKDTGLLTELANGLLDRLRRTPTWLHLPVPIDRDDAAYFAPLGELRLPAGSELYLGLVHAGDEEGTRRRIESARQVVPDFGVATECGLGRTPRDQIAELLHQHAAVAAAW